MDPIQVPASNGKLLKLMMRYSRDTWPTINSHISKILDAVKHHNSDVDKCIADVKVVNDPLTPIDKKVECILRYKDTMLSIRNKAGLSNVRYLESLDTPVLRVIELPDNLIATSDSCKRDMILSAPSMSLGKKKAPEHVTDLLNLMKADLINGELPDIEKVTNKSSPANVDVSKLASNERNLYQDYILSITAIHASGNTEVLTGLNECIDAADQVDGSKSPLGKI